jgi:hypothetical protein
VILSCLPGNKEDMHWVGPDLDVPDDPPKPASECLALNWLLAIRDRLPKEGFDLAIHDGPVSTTSRILSPWTPGPD